jgi:hypothetical protein
MRRDTYEVDLVKFLVQLLLPLRMPCQLKKHVAEGVTCRICPCKDQIGDLNDNILVRQRLRPSRLFALCDQLLQKIATVTCTAIASDIVLKSLSSVLCRVSEYLSSGCTGGRGDIHHRSDVQQ